MVGLVPVLREALDENNEDRIVVRTGTHANANKQIFMYRKIPSCCSLN